ncbi:MAG: hypothetical protein TREMPRED_005780 [Tremellales sp. Tagirdzhanova-0007]|nr:MAG: hypothetical protein TREMPRED_005780 [Tremellales sp. Tagirdzhanova-0007]
MSQIDAIVFCTAQPDERLDFQLVTIDGRHREAALTVLEQVAMKMQIEVEIWDELLQLDSLQSTILDRVERLASIYDSLASVKWDCVRVESARYDWITELDRQMVGSDLSTQAAMFQEITELIQDPIGIHITVIFSHQCVTAGDVVKISVCSGTLISDLSTKSLRLKDRIESFLLESASPEVKDFRNTHQYTTNNDDYMNESLGNMLCAFVEEHLFVPYTTKKGKQRLRYKQVSYGTSLVLKEVMPFGDWELDDPDPE